MKETTASEFFCDYSRRAKVAARAADAPCLGSASVDAACRLTPAPLRGISSPEGAPANGVPGEGLRITFDEEPFSPVELIPIPARPERIHITDFEGSLLQVIEIPAIEAFADDDEPPRRAAPDAK